MRKDKRVLKRLLKTCPKCGNKLKQVVDSIAKKKTGHLWSCKCSPGKMISIG